jgi:hypothetical protein
MKSARKDFDWKNWLSSCGFIGYQKPQLEDEFLNKLDDRLYEKIGWLCIYQKFHLNKSGKLFIVTSVLRDWPKQDKIYGHDVKDEETQKKYIDNPWPSVHMMIPGCGVDGKTKIEKYIDRIIARDFIEIVSFYGDKTHKSLLFHDVGLGLHAHIQCKPIEGRNVLCPGKSRYA